MDSCCAGGRASRQAGMHAQVQCCARAEAALFLATLRFRLCQRRHAFPRSRCSSVPCAGTWTDFDCRLFSRPFVGNVRVTLQGTAACFGVKYQLEYGQLSSPAPPAGSRFVAVSVGGEATSWVTDSGDVVTAGNTCLGASCAGLLQPLMQAPTWSLPMGTNVGWVCFASDGSLNIVTCVDSAFGSASLIRAPLGNVLTGGCV